MKHISVDQDVFDFLTSKANAPDESPAAVLRRELHVPLPQQTLEIDDDTYSFIAARTTVVGESVSDILRREFQIAGGAPVPPSPAPDPPPVTPADPPAPDPPADVPALIEFHIRPGTGSASWNDGSSRVIAKVGDTLRIVNNDLVAHRPQTSGGRPFLMQGSDIFPGDSADFLLLTPYDPSLDGPLFDHDQGTQALFFLEVASRT